MKLLDMGRLPEAVALVSRQLSDESKLYSSTISDVCLALAKEGSHEEVCVAHSFKNLCTKIVLLLQVAELLGKVSNDKILGNRFSDLQHFYSSRTEFGDAGKLVLELLNTRGLLPKQAQNKSVLLMEIDTGEYDRAIELFAAMAAKEKKLRHKHQLVSALVKVRNHFYLKYI